MKSILVRDFITFLDRQTRASFRGSTVDEFLTENRIDLDDLLPYVRFREDTYARNQVIRTPLYELMALAWLPGQKAAIHDHSGQKCWMTVENGEITVQDYEPIYHLDSPPVISGDPEVIPTGGRVYIDNGIGLHSIHNRGRLPAITLHVYSGPIQSCLVFDEEKKIFTPVELRCFPPPEMEEQIEPQALLG